MRFHGRSPMRDAYGVRGRFREAEMFWRILRSKSNAGQGFIEYIMITGLIGIALVAALVAFQGQISTALNTVGIGV